VGRKGRSERVFRPADRRVLHEVLARQVGIEESLKSIVAILREMAGPRVRFIYTVGAAQLKEKKMPLDVTITNVQKIDITASPTTGSGKPAKLDGPLKVTVQSGDSTVTQDPANPLMFTLVSSDTPGDTVYLVDGDADLGSGVEDIQDTITLHVTGENAKNLGLVAGSPVDK
jgi:hypothetical protein